MLRSERELRTAFGQCRDRGILVLGGYSRIKRNDGVLGSCVRRQRQRCAERINESKREYAQDNRYLHLMISK